MGNKQGYGETILAALGLRSGQGADAYVWAEADPDVRALLRAYPDADMLRRIAEIIRGWKDEEPRALWERLRAERKARNAQATHDVAETSSWIYLAQTHHEAGTLRGGFVHPEEGGRYGAGREETADRCHRLAEYASIAPVGGVAGAFERVAGWITEHAGTHPGGGDFRGLHIHRPNVDGFIPGRAALATGCTRLPSRWPPVAVIAALPTAAELSAMLGTPGDLEGVVIMSDPPYENTTGYAHTLPRSEVVRLALDWSASGAHVCVCEQEPIPALMDAGWFATRVTDGRKGQRRTFSRQSEEYLTLNRPSAHTVAKQVSMFTTAPPYDKVGT